MGIDVMGPKFLALESVALESVAVKSVAKKMRDLVLATIKHAGF